MLPRFQVAFGFDELSASLSLNSPDALSHFEETFAAEFETAYAVAFPYGRTAQLALLEVSGLRDGEIICPAYTCVVVAHAIVESGNKPVFVDSGLDANMDLGLLEEKITEKTLAIIPTSIFGNPVNLEKLYEISERFPDIKIFQDCAHSFACEWEGRPVHAAGLAAFYGCNISKIVTSIFGGMVTTNDPALYRKLKAWQQDRLSAPSVLRSLSRRLYLIAAGLAFKPFFYGLTCFIRDLGLLSSLEKYYDDAKIDMPTDYLVGLSSVEARVGTSQIMRMREFIVARREYAEYYVGALSGLKSIEFISYFPGASYSHIAAIVQNRDEIVDQAAANGIELGTIIDYVIPEMPAYRLDKDPIASGPNRSSWPISNQLAKHVVNLPASGSFSLDKAAKVVRVMKAILAKEPQAPSF